LRSERGGVLADIGSHLIDLSMWLLGPISRVRCDLRTFTRERPDRDGVLTPIDVDDAATCQLELDSGAVVAFNVSGQCLGRLNHQRIEVYGTKGGAVYEIDRPGDLGGDRLHVCFGEAQHRTVGMAPARILPRHEATPLDPILDFFRAVHDGRPAAVTFEDAVRVQAVLDAAEQSAAAGGVWVEIPQDS
jgi:predicted dehydrogenase